MSDWNYPHIRRHPDGRQWQVVGVGDVELYAGDLASCKQRMAEFGHRNASRKSDKSLRRAIDSL